MESQRASQPPQRSYTANGKTVQVRADSKITQQIRSKPSSHYRPEVRKTVIVNHVTNNRYTHYSHPANWYYSQPTFYVGGGYSSAFWWMMSEWSAERRAMWLYNHQYEIDRAAYQRGLQDAAVAAQIRQLEARNAARNADYVDPEFASDPSLMYTDDHIQAAYNPVVYRPYGFYSFFRAVAIVVVSVVILFCFFVILNKIRV